MVFESAADNLVAGDTGFQRDIFVHDRDTGVTEIVSLATDGAQGNNSSWGADISGDGRFVVFGSWADNLVAGDTNGYSDIFVHDRDTGMTERVSLATDGTQGNHRSFDAEISDDGSTITFTSTADDLVAGDTNDALDVFTIGNPLFDAALFSTDADVVTLPAPGTYHALAGDDQVTGTDGADTIFGNAGHDVLIGRGGDDRLAGNRGNDRLEGRQGNDVLNGGGGNDVMRGGNGADVLNGGLGRDVLNGGRGQDAFIFREGHGRDKIGDFADDVDTLRLDDNLWSGSRSVAQLIDDFASVVGSDVVFDFGGDVLILKDFGSTGTAALLDDITIF